MTFLECISEKLWSAPELLRKGFEAMSHDQVQKSDLYSTGIIMNEIFCRLGTFPLPDEYSMLSPMGEPFLLKIRFYLIQKLILDRMSLV